METLISPNVVMKLLMSLPALLAMAAVALAGSNYLDPECISICAKAANPSECANSCDICKYQQSKGFIPKVQTPNIATCAQVCAEPAHKGDAYCVQNCQTAREGCCTSPFGCCPFNAATLCICRHTSLGC
ncbi:hypothetical protein OC834_006483 [Tilletia horrida]|nr:hypothetical protein OC834_006483 [Tilletia horrida]